MKEIIFILLMSFVLASCGLKKPLTLNEPEDDTSLDIDVV